MGIVVHAYIYVCVCVCVCARARARACARVMKRSYLLVSLYIARLKIINRLELSLILYLLLFYITKGVKKIFA